ncbi:hypothetical protein PHYBLDRAFT_72160 [Phycomyces blakesleeanus NRRL 1555(-)]|uniref:DDE Tnp4 domain-containing protein n=1 Tax=Phycomyces blakesleeanus (strain ATCC 8743b / DSM 1359 / FGSC 10004 / NBRC 33097 / NRRL 1555) TaxID=763407 RepID=A0A163D060_PHYB8|nr:hypothetical protein PHYBLDRAFT_72160 [Phycomyces blakesleeanus NRRL 1555(-)]OAD67750.1 hypothetical protein PHYBLDRAFT_72160 [Phycomyces blakesleeanus NRRL 1555(-)]|eukprot:XP_018285790.1 hypothetical protein PHYBLDRAFT_72160 [Phycomyces blakesleeanus NRRL 1555(-)]
MALLVRKSSFYKLYDLVKIHELYQQLSGFYSIDVRLQISIVLDRLGSNGNSLSSDHLARHSGIGKGSIENITIRFFKVILSLEHKFIYWPTKSEKAEIKRANEYLLGFPNLVRYLDGCLFKLAKALSWKPEQFFSHRSAYCVNNVACELGKFPEQFFSDDEYVLADVGYKATNYIVPIKKKPRNSELSLADQEFNTKISSMQVKIEHAFGILKERFYYLKSIPKAKRRWEDREKSEVARLRKTEYSEESGVVDGSQIIDGNTRWIQTQHVVMSKEKNKSS